jgi:predicted nuclease with TOPRIM domain
MLAPNQIDSEEDVAAAASGLAHVTAFARSCQSIAIGKLSPQPGWLDEITATLQRTQQTAMDWFDQQPDIVPAMREAFGQYQSLFSAVTTDVNPKTTDATTWEQMLRGMHDQLIASAANIDTTQQKMKNVYDAFAEVHTDIRDAIQQAWAQHEEAHDALTRIAGQIGALYEQLGALSQEASASEYESGKKVVDTVAEIVMPIFKEVEEDISFVSIGFSLLSIGQSLFSTISANEEINKTLSELHDLLNEQSEEIQALAATNALLALLDAMDQSYLELVSNRVPKLSEMLRAEASKITTAMSGLVSGANPATDADLLSLNIAQVVWNQLADLAQKIGSGADEDGGTITLSPKTQTAAKAAAK